MDVLADIIYYTSLVLVCCIYATTPIVFWEIKRFVSVVNFNDDFWRCRQPIFNIVYIVSYLFVLYILNPLTIFLYNIIGIETIVPLFVNDVADLLIFLLLFPRAWILWFDRAFFDNLKNWLWRRELNPQDSNFLVRYRTILKSSHLIVYSVYLLIVAPVFTVLNILPYFDILQFGCDIMRTCLHVILFFLTSYIVRQISVVFDEHHIRKELLGTVNKSGVAYIFGHIAFVILEHYFTNRHLALLIELLFICISHIFVLYYALHWTRVTYEKARKIRLMSHLKLQDGRRSSFLGVMSKRIQFQDIMDHRNGIEAFCNHLQNEFGLESILFLLEVTQYKAVIRDMSDGLIEDNVPTLCDWHATDYSSVNPLTSTRHVFSADKHVFSSASILNIKWLPIDPRMFTLKPHQIALHIYDKYVDEGADLTINISFSIRRDIYRYFQQILHEQQNQDEINVQIDSNDKQNNDNNPLVQMYKIYDSAFTAIWRLIQTDSFLRFKSTDDFRRLATVLFPKEAEEANTQLAKMVDAELTRERREERRRAREKRFTSETSPSSSFPIPQTIHGNTFATPDFATVLHSIPEEIGGHGIPRRLGQSNSVSNSISRSPRGRGTAMDILRLTKSLSMSTHKKKSHQQTLPMLPYEQTSAPLIANLLTTENITQSGRRHTTMPNLSEDFNQKKQKQKKQNNNESISEVSPRMTVPLTLNNSQSLPTTPGEMQQNKFGLSNLRYAQSNQPPTKTTFNRVSSNSQTLEENELKYTFTTINNGMPSESC